MLRRMSAWWVLAAVLVATGSVATQSAVASAATGEYGFAGSAYGTQVTLGKVVKSGRSALAVLGCVSQTGVSNTNTAVSVHAPPVLSTGTIDTSAASRATATGIASSSSSDVQSVSVLAGEVSATVVKSVSTTSENTSSGAFSVSAAGTTFTHLVVAGHSVSGTPAPNTKINLPGIGYVVLNQQTSHVAATRAGLTVIAIHLVVTQSSSKAAAGTQVEVAFANSSLGGPVTGLLSGLAYGANAHVGKTVIAGLVFPQYLACLGTNGKVKTNSGATVNLPGILTSGTVTDTAEGTDTATTVTGTVTSTVQQLNLLSGEVKATLVKADVSASGSPPTLTDDSSFGGLTVAGHSVSNPVPPNTKMPLSGIGTLWLHRVLKTAHGINVIMIQLVITSASNPYGLKLGTKVNVAYARVGIK